MVSVCLPFDALLQHLPSYLGFSYLGRGVSFHGCSSKAQPLLLTLDKGYLIIAALPDLQRGIAPLGPPALAQPRLLGRGVSLHSCSSKPEWKDHCLSYVADLSETDRLEEKNTHACLHVSPSNSTEKLTLFPHLTFRVSCGIYPLGGLMLFMYFLQERCY